MAKADIDVKYVSELARLELPEEQFAAIEKDLLDIVGYIAELSEVDVTGVEPTAHAAALSNVWREDASEDSGLRDAMQRFRDIKGIRIIEFNEKDIVRHPLVKRIVAAYAG